MKTTMPAHIALYLITAMLAAATGDKVTPVINAARLDAKGKSLRAIATDRYRVHEVITQHAVTHATKGESVIISVNMLNQIKRLIKAFAPRRVEVAETRVTIQSRRLNDTDTQLKVTISRADDSLTVTGPAVRGNFPPVDRLVASAEKDPRYLGRLKLNPTFLGQLQQLNPGTHPAAEFKPTCSADNPDKPGPVYVTFDADGTEARALIMPNLVLQ